MGAPPADSAPVPASSPGYGPAAPPLAVLLAEHELEVAEMARRYLTRAGFSVTIATGVDETTAALTARTAAVAVAVLDLTMPGLDARRLRRLLIDPSSKNQQSQSPQQPQKTRPSRLPTLFLLSASMRPRDLRIAAESCLRRPFSPRLLVSRVLAIAPRPIAPRLIAPRPLAPRPLAPGSTADSAPGQLTLPTLTSSCIHTLVPAVPLTPAESALLAALADHPGYVLSRNRLQAIVSRSTPGHPASGRAIDVHVSQLRAKLPDPSLIRTVRGVGYILDEAGQTGPDPQGG